MKASVVVAWTDTILVCRLKQSPRVRFTFQWGLITIASRPGPTPM